LLSGRGPRSLDPKSFPMKARIGHTIYALYAGRI
jgi:hypothetical protein